MTITLTREQQEWLEAEVAAGRFRSVEEGVRLAVEELKQAAAGSDDFAWAKPYIDEARASLASGDSASWDEVKQELADRINSLR
jgi:antitoxin ParD1/3/4